MLYDIQKEILRLKKETNTCILAHCYQAHEILEIADYTGDSFGLSVEAAKTDAPNLLMCGVRFMAETAKMLSPQKRVLLASPSAGCPMAEQFGPEEVVAWKSAHPDGVVVAYVNTTAELKRVCDVCVTSASACKILEKIDAPQILFIPDANLGSYIKKQLPHKNITLWNGCCPIHASVTEQEVLEAKKEHPAALLLAHPECTAAVLQHADYVGSTTEIMKYAADSAHTEFLIGTENSIVAHLQYALPGKRIYPLSKKLLCADMKLTTLADVLACLKGEGGCEILLPEQTLLEARRCIDQMLLLG